MRPAAKPRDWTASSTARALTRCRLPSQAALRPQEGFRRQGRPPDPAPTLVDQPRLQDTPVYQTGMQLVVPPGQEWTFRDPGTGAFLASGRTCSVARSSRTRRQGRAGRTKRSRRPGGVPATRTARTSPFSAPWAGDQFALPPGAGPDTRLAAPAARKRGRKVPLFIGAGAAVVVLGVGVAVAIPRLTQHTDPGCAAYKVNALPAYNQTITDLNNQASQATLSSDLTTAIAQLSAAAGQAQAAPVKSALQGLLTQLTQVQADTQKGSVPAATVSQLNTAATTVDSAC